MKKLQQTWPFNPQKLPFFYGWIILAAATIGMVMSAPGQTIGVSVFTDILIDALGMSRVQISLAYALGTIGSSLIVGRVGPLIDRYGVRPVATLTALAFGVTLFGMSQIDRIANLLTSGDWVRRMQTGVRFGILVTGFLSMRFLGQGTITLSSRTMLMKWFDRFRGRVNSVMGIFVTLIFSGSPLVMELLIERFTWRGAWIALGLIAGPCFAVIVALFFRDNPRECGLHVDGTTPDTSKESAQPADTSFTLNEARRTWSFWMFNLATAMFSLLITAITFHIVSIFQTAGKTRDDAISIFLPASILAVTLNLTIGYLSDTPLFRYRLKYWMLLCLGGLLTSCLGIVLLGSGGGRILMIIGRGVATGMFGTMVGIVWPRYFGTANLGAIAGYNMSFLVFASAIGPILFSLPYRFLGSYNAAAILFSLLIGLLMLLATKANPPVRNAPRASPSA